MLKFVCWCDVNLYFFLWGSACADRYIDDMRFTICKNAVEKCGCVCVCACVCVCMCERVRANDMEILLRKILFLFQKQYFRIHGYQEHTYSNNFENPIRHI